MCTIIQFPTRESNGYKNLVALFDVCSSVKSCNFYLESVEQLFDNGAITENELYTLRRIGRQKRIILVTPQQAAQTAKKPGTYLYTPEIGQQQPEGCQMEARRAYYGKHFFIDSPIDIKGRGITAVEAHWIAGCKKQIENWKCYRVTNAAFEKLQQQYSISIECCLD